MAEEKVGTVSDYFARVGVAGITLVAPLKVGDTIRIHGHTTDFTQTVESMQIEHESVQEAGPGVSVGVKVIDRCRHGDTVFKII